MEWSHISAAYFVCICYKHDSLHLGWYRERERKRECVVAWDLQDDIKKRDGECEGKRAKWRYRLNRVFVIMKVHVCWKRREREIICVFKKGDCRPHFHLLSFLKNNLLNSNCRFQGDSNSDHHGRKEACWPLDHHHGYARNSVKETALSRIAIAIAIAYPSTVFFIWRKFLSF